MCRKRLSHDAQSMESSNIGVVPPASVWMPPPMVLPVWLCRRGGVRRRARRLNEQAAGQPSPPSGQRILTKPTQNRGSSPRHPLCPALPPWALAWKPRPSALTTPVVSVRSKPKGLPMARQACPTRTCRRSEGAGEESRAASCHMPAAPRGKAALLPLRLLAPCAGNANMPQASSQPAPSRLPA